MDERCLSAIFAKSLLSVLDTLRGLVESTGMPFSSQSTFDRKMRKLSLKLEGGGPRP